LTGRGARPRALFRRIRFELLCGAVLCGLVGWTGCSVERHYAMLSFFFDGVPNPNALPVSGASGDPATIRASLTYSAHTPYLEGQCVECHGQGFTMSAIDVGVCMNCHGEVPDEHRYMHGPVAVGACLVCHVAHESAYSHLMKSDAQSVCAQCHAPEMLSVERVPEHRDPSVSCLQCHTGHGDDERFMLRDGPLADAGGAGRGRGGGPGAGTGDPGTGDPGAGGDAPGAADDDPPAAEETGG
jgi:predicted CXXCH cytochrome family protein